jgi:iron-sulfur cluster assembly protein
MMDTRYLILITLLAFCLAQSRAFFRPFGKPSLKQTRLLADVSTLDETNAGIEERVIKITEKAMTHLSDLKAKQGLKKCLRMGVRAGGCSGMSYVMDFIDEADITDDDHIEEYEGIKCVVDPKSLLYIYGLNLDYSDELIGGGFKFTNPNAETSCGCGKSFGV